MKTLFSKTFNILFVWAISYINFINIFYQILSNTKTDILQGPNFFSLLIIIGSDEPAINFGK